MEKRVIIAVILSIAVLYGYSFLMPPAPKKAEEVKPATQQSAAPQVPVSLAKPGAVALAEPAVAPARDIVVETDLYRAVFSSRGGTLKNLFLKKYRETEGPGGKQVTLVAEEPPEFYDLKSEAQGFAVDPAVVCSVNSDGFTLGKGDKKVVEFTCSSPQGTMLKKAYTFQGDSYAIDLNQQLVNTSPVKQEGVLRLVLNHRIEPAVKVSRFEEHGPVTMMGKDVIALKAKDLEKGPKQYDTDVHWTGYADKYFLSAVIAGTGSLGGVTIRADRGFVENAISSAKTSLNPGEVLSLSYKLYFGPKDLDILKAQGNQLEKVIDLGWFSAVAKPLLYSLKFLYRYVHNYGIAIIIITVIIKILFYPLTYKSYKSMKDMQKLQPKMAELKEKYKNDRDAMNKAVMELYQTHKVNPLGGCLPMLVQFPIFVALYRALMSSIELRHAPFLLWMRDLAAPDALFSHMLGLPFTLGPLPVLMGASMFVQQKMTPATGMDPAQAKMMMALPLVFTVMFLNMPTGLVLYWLVNNILTIAQQMYINKLLKEG
ncbi:MAG TPA: membrane protein insertase YidC [Geobacteraceae bacterium]|nr:membrane protein insertase YidC [Geobacteraceae bacterium]